MITTFLEPGGDADFSIAVNNNFWADPFNVTVSADYVHGTHKKSLKYDPAFAPYNGTPNGVCADAGTRGSFYIYFTAFPASGKAYFLSIRAATPTFTIYVTSAGILQLYRGTGTAQMGSNGSTLQTGRWYRISFAYTIASSTVNEFRIFLNGNLDITASNVASIVTGTTMIRYGNFAGTAVVYFYTSDHYIDNDNSLTDTGDIWVTAKRPVANGSLNEFTTQIGAGGSGYGSGHSPQVNERNLNTVNGWSIQNAAKKTEEYTIEAANIGDIDISEALAIVDYMGWVSAKVGSASTGNIIVAGTSTNISVTTAYKIFTKIAGSSVYPTGNTDIGMDTNTVNQLFSLAECGIIVAYIPGQSSLPHKSLVGVGA